MAILSLPVELDDNLLGYLTNLELQHFARLNRQLLLRVKAFMSRAFRFRQALSPFLLSTEIETLNELQRATGLFVSGNTVLHFLLRSGSQTQQLDLFVHMQYRHTVLACVNSTCYKEEFSAKGASVTEQLNLYTDMRVPFDIEHWSSLELRNSDAVAYKLLLSLKDTPYKIKIHFSKGPAIQMVLNFPTNELSNVYLLKSNLFMICRQACVMNLATHTRVYSLYPRATFHENVSQLCLDWRGLVSDKDLEPFNDMGLHIVERLPNELPQHVFPKGTRRIGDSHTWTIDIEDAGLEDYNYGILTNTWAVRYEPSGQLALQHQEKDFGLLLALSVFGCL